MKPDTDRRFKRGTNRGTNRPVRDPAREHDLLEQAAGLAANADAFTAMVKSRLRMGHRVYRDRWTTVPVAGLLTEALEEIADLAAWSLLTFQALDTANLTPADASTVRSLIQQSLAQAVEVHANLAAAVLIAGGPE